MIPSSANLSCVANVSWQISSMRCPVPDRLRGPLQLTTAARKPVLLGNNSICPNMEARKSQHRGLVFKACAINNPDTVRFSKLHLSGDCVHCAATAPRKFLLHYSPKPSYQEALMCLARQKPLLHSLVNISLRGSGWAPIPCYSGVSGMPALHKRSSVR